MYKATNNKNCYVFGAGLLTAALTMLAVAPNAAQAQAVESGVVEACYTTATNSKGDNTGSGSIYRIKMAGVKPTSCGTDTPVNWNVKGDKGDTGAAGATGATGAVGPQGPAGAKGDKGDKGDQGLKGDTGAPGTNGTNGEQGLKGDQGIQGPKGDAGTNGTNGTDGAKGDKGDQGIQGVKGDAGTNGTNGTNGEQGPKGDKGDQGIQGEKGEVGAQGPKGETGATGATGPQGPVGPTGLSGWERKQGQSTTATEGRVTSLIVACSAGKSILGGGYSNPDNKGTSNTVLASFPRSQTEWEVQIFNPSGSTSFGVVPFAVCATVTQ